MAFSVYLPSSAPWLRQEYLSIKSGQESTYSIWGNLCPVWVQAWPRGGNPAPSREEATQSWHATDNTLALQTYAAVKQHRNAYKIQMPVCNDCTCNFVEIISWGNVLYFSFQHFLHIFTLSFELNETLYRFQYLSSSTYILVNPETTYTNAVVITETKFVYKFVFLFTWSVEFFILVHKLQTMHIHPALIHILSLYPEL